MARYLFLTAVIVICVMFARRLWRSRIPRDGLGPDRLLADHALAGCRQLLLLVQALQRHRGMSSALLAGEQTLAPALDRLRGELNGLFLALAPVARRESDMAWPCFSYHELMLARHQWDALNADLPGLSAAQSVVRHSKIIKQMLAWLAALGEARIGQAFPHRLSGDLALNYAYRLPALVECLGQAREVGCGACAGCDCPPEIRSQLSLLLARAETLLARIGEPSGNPGAMAACVEVRALSLAIRNDLLDSREVSPAAVGDFDRVGRVVDSLFAWIEQCSAELESALVGSPRLMAT